MLTREDLQEITKLLQKCETRDEINIFFRLCKARSGAISEMKTAMFSPGDRIQFRGKRNIVVKGKVTKVNRKTISVLTDSGQAWRVSAGILEEEHSS
ncbi:MAG TPA: hypothetical protein VMX17_09070 [Candidatus Glassbacteria bacterium]|nr:hypothetical protein [Candidatus Glassbacteria bacterium]